MTTSKKGGKGGGGTPRIQKKKLNEKSMRLPVTLTDKEFIKYADELAQVDYDLKAHKDYTDEVKKQLAHRNAELVSLRSRLSAMVKTRTESREITVEGWAFFAEGLYKEVRTDTNQVIPGSTRPLQADERQERLALDSEGGPAAHLTPEQRRKLDEKLAADKAVEGEADEDGGDDKPKK